MAWPSTLRETWEVDLEINDKSDDLFPVLLSYHQVISLKLLLLKLLN